MLYKVVLVTAVQQGASTVHISPPSWVSFPPLHPTSLEDLHRVPRHLILNLQTTWEMLQQDKDNEYTFFDFLRSLPQGFHEWNGSYCHSSLFFLLCSLLSFFKIHSFFKESFITFIIIKCSELVKKKLSSL